MASFSSGARRQLAPSKPLVLAVFFYLICDGSLPGVRAQFGHAQRGVPLRPVSLTPACGTKFVDPSSSALLADVVLKGSVEDLRQASPITPLLYKAKVNVHKVYKGQELLTAATSGYSGNNNRENSSSSSSNNGSVRKRSRVEVVQVERFGPVENRENCVGHVEEGQVYLFFLRVKDAPSAALGIQRSATGAPSSSSSLLLSAPSSLSFQRNGNGSVVVGGSYSGSSGRGSSGPVLVNTALPAGVDLKTLRKVKKVLCPDCPAVPVIRKLRCRHCAERPFMRRAMSANNTKTVRIGKKLALRCVARGTPKPSYTWVKDGVLLYRQAKEEQEGAEGESTRTTTRRRRQSSGGGRGRSGKHGGAEVFRSGTMSVRNSRHHSRLVVKRVKPQDQGTYLCLAANPVGEVEQRVQVVVEGRRSRSRSRPSPPTSDLDPPSSPARGEDENDNDDDEEVGEDPCAFNPCYNGGTCLVAEDGEAERAGSRRARCDCLPDYHGTRCQFKRRTTLPAAAVVLEEGHIQTTPHLQLVNNRDNNNNNNDDDDNSNDSQHVDRIQSSDHPTPTRIYPLITTSETASGAAIFTPQGLRPPVSHRRQIYLSEKHRRKYGITSGGVRYGIRNKASRSGTPQLKVSECPAEEGYCFNGGKCKIVVKLQRRFCLCPRGFAGRRCEQRV